MANKAKTVFGLIAAIAAVVVLPLSFQAWAEGQTEEQIREAELIQQGRNEATHSGQAHEMAKQSAKHDYDFYDIRAQQAEEQLVQLEEDADAGVQLTSSQQRKMRRLEKQVEDFLGEQDKALTKLSAAEDHEDET